MATATAILRPTAGTFVQEGMYGWSRSGTNWLRTSFLSGTDWWSQIAEDVDGTLRSSAIGLLQDAALTLYIEYRIGPLPADFVSMLAFGVRSSTVFFNHVDDYIGVDVRVLSSGGSQLATASGGGTQIVSQTGAASLPASPNKFQSLNLTSLGSTSTKSDWEAARIYNYFTHSASMGGDAATVLLVDIQFEITYESNLNPPSAVTNLAGTAGANQVALTWSAPADNGSPITDYIVQRREVG